MVELEYLFHLHHSVEDRQAQVGCSSLTWRNSTHHIGAIRNGLLTVEGALGGDRDTRVQGSSSIADTGQVAVALVPASR